MIFNRREALKSLAMLPVLKGSQAVQIGDPKTKHYMLFYDKRVLDAQTLCEYPGDGLFPKDATMICIGVHLQHDQTIDDAIRIYEVK